MTIRSHDPSRLELRGVPNGYPWLVFGCVLCLVMLVAIAFFWRIFSSLNNRIGLGLGAVLVLTIFVCLVDLALQRESLVLDAARAKGEYLRRSLLRGQLEHCDFPLANIASVELETYIQESPGHSFARNDLRSGRCLRAKLLISKPRKAIILDDTQNHREHRVESLAIAVAEFLGTTPTRRGQSTDL